MCSSPPSRPSETAMSSGKSLGRGSSVCRIVVAAIEFSFDARTFEFSSMVKQAQLVRRGGRMTEQTHRAENSWSSVCSSPPSRSSEAATSSGKAFRKASPVSGMVVAAIGSSFDARNFEASSMLKQTQLVHRGGSTTEQMCHAENSSFKFLISLRHNKFDYRA